MLDRGWGYFKYEKYDQAGRDCSDVIELKPLSVEARRLRGFALLRKKEYDKAIAEFTVIISWGVEISDVYEECGEAWYAKNEFESAWRL